MASALTRRRRPTPAATLPPRLAQRVPAKLVQHHSKLVQRFEAATIRERELAREIEAARREDVRAAEDAVAAGRPIPDATVNAKLVERDQVQRELDAIEQVAGESARELLRTAAPKARALSDQMRGEADEIEDRAFGEVEQGIASFREAGSRRSEASWLAELASAPDPSRIAPYRGGTGSGEAERLIGQALARIRAERAEARERRARRERAERAERERAAS